MDRQSLTRRWDNTIEVMHVETPWEYSIFILHAVELEVIIALELIRVLVN